MIYPDCLTRPNCDNTFIGVAIAQSWNDLALWEAFLDEHSIASLLELGTFHGGMALFLALQGWARGFMVDTIDRPGHEPLCLSLLTELRCTYRAIDLFSDAGLVAVGELISALPKPLMLLVDNGNKREEWRRFVPLLSPGDYSAVHDWGSEFHDRDRVPPLEPLFESTCGALASITRFFRVP